MNLPPRAYVYDETIREEEEAPGMTVAIKDKVDIAVKLDRSSSVIQRVT